MLPCWPKIVRNFIWQRAQCKTSYKHWGKATARALSEWDRQAKQCLAALHSPPPSISCCQQWVGMWSCDPFPYTCWRAGLGNPPHCCVWACNIMFAVTLWLFIWLSNATKNAFHFLCRLVFLFYCTLTKKGGWLLNAFNLHSAGFATDNHCQQAFWHERVCMSPLQVLRHSSASYNRVSDDFSQHAGTGKEIICSGM